MSYETKPSHYPLIRFECEFTKQETPTHVEVIPAANANRDGVEWSNERQRLNVFPSLNMSSPSNPIRNHTPDNFYNQSQGDGRAPIMPRHILLEGKLRADDRWEMLDVIELPFSYHELPYPLYKLIYQRRIKYIRFIVVLAAERIVVDMAQRVLERCKDALLASPVVPVYYQGLVEGFIPTVMKCDPKNPGSYMGLDPIKDEGFSKTRPSYVTCVSDSVHGKDDVPVVSFRVYTIFKTLDFYVLEELIPAGFNPSHLYKVLAEGDLQFVLEQFEKYTGNQPVLRLEKWPN